MIKILALNTISKISSIAIYNNNKIIYTFKKCDNNQHLYIFPLITSLINKNNNINLKTINLFVFNKGPGSLIGIQLAKSILYTWNLIFNTKIIEICNLNLLVFNYYMFTKKNKLKIYEKILVIIHYNSFYICSYYIINNNKIITYLKKKIIISLFQITNFLILIEKGIIITDLYTKQLLLKNKLINIKLVKFFHHFLNSDAKNLIDYILFNKNNYNI